MAGRRELEAAIRISGELDARLRRSIENAVSSLDGLDDAAMQASDAAGRLSDMISQQNDTLRAAQRQYAAYVISGEQGSRQAQDLANEIRALSEDLSRNQSILHQAENAAQQLGAGLDNASRQASDAVDNLSNTINSQRDALQAAQRQYAAYVLNGERGSRQARELANQIRGLSSNLNQNEERMRVAEEAAQRLAGRLDDVGDSAENTDSGFTVMKGAIAGVISNGISALIGKCTEAASSLYGLAEETREFRQDMATLETAYDKAGFSAETAGDTWKDLYAIFGEDDRAVEAANNIARMSKNQQSLDKWVKISTGIWGVYQDALPVESLAEAADESAKVGTVVGTLADALNWNSEAAKMFADYMGGDVKSAEDAFNVALSECTTEAERQALVTDTLIKLYGESADKYNSTAASIIEANKATADYTVAAANLGERIEPVTTAVQAGFAQVLDKVLELTQDVDFQALASKVQGGFSYIVDTVLPKVKDGFQWVMDNKDPIIAVIVGIASAFGAWQIVSIVMTVISAIQNLGGVLSAAKAAMAALNAVMSANPIGLIIALVTGLVAAFIYLWNNCEGFRMFWINLWENIKLFFGQAVQWISMKLSEMGAFFSSVFNTIGSVISGVFNAAWSTVSGFFSWIGEKLSWLSGAIENIPVIGSLYGGAKSAIGGLLGGGEVKAYAKGGFTDGVSIAGEAGTEAIISFDPRYRAQNLSYWAKAGQMLGASDMFLSDGLSGGSSGGDVTFGGVTFAPQITITGMADKQTVMEAIEDEYPEFIDLLESWWAGRGKPVYG